MRQLHVRPLLISSFVLPSLVLGLGVLAPALGVVSCGDTIIVDTTLTNLDPVTTTVCPCDGLLVVDGVTLSLGGRTIQGSGVCTGIVILDLASVTVHTGTIAGFGTGIGTEPLTSTSATTLSGLVIRNNDVGVSLAASNSLLTGLQVRQNTGAGIHISASGTTVEKSVVRQNDGDCIVVDDGPAAQDKNIVRLTRCEDNGGRGLVIRGVMNTVARNVLLRNGSDGADIDGSGDTIDRNQAKYNGGEGFKIEGSNHTVTLNQAVSNVEDGYTISATGSTFQRNIANYNGRPDVGWGILDSTTDGGTGGTANTYSKNGCTGNGLGNSSPIGLCN